MKGLIVEGVTAAGKSTLLNDLQRRLVAELPAATKLFFSEHYTDRVFNSSSDNCADTPELVLQHLDTLASQVLYLHDLQDNGIFRHRGGNAEIFVLFERFLGSHYASLSGHLGADRLGAFVAQSCRILERLARTGFSVAVLDPAPEYLSSAVQDTMLRRNAAWRSFIEELGVTDELGDHFSSWQGRLLSFYRLAQNSINVQVFPVDSRESLQAVCQKLWAGLCPPSDSLSP